MNLSKMNKELRLVFDNNGEHDFGNSHKFFDVKIVVDWKIVGSIILVMHEKNLTNKVGFVDVNVFVKDNIEVDNVSSIDFVSRKIISEANAKAIENASLRGIVNVLETFGIRRLTLDINRYRANDYEDENIIMGTGFRPFKPFDLNAAMLYVPAKNGQKLNHYYYNAGRNASLTPRELCQNLYGEEKMLPVTLEVVDLSDHSSEK